MKSKLSFIVAALCALGACASLTACMTDGQNSEDENAEKAKTNTQIVEQQNGDCPDGDCPEEQPATPDTDVHPKFMPEFRFAPPPEHMPTPAENDDAGSKRPMPAPHRKGGAKPKTPKTSD